MFYVVAKADIASYSISAGMVLEAYDMSTDSGLPIFVPSRFGAGNTCVFCGVSGEGAHWSINHPSVEGVYRLCGNTIVVVGYNYRDEPYVVSETYDERSRSFYEAHFEAQTQPDDSNFFDEV